MKDQVLSQSEIDALFASASQAPVPTQGGQPGPAPAGPEKAAFPPLATPPAARAPVPSPVASGPVGQGGSLPISLLSDVELEVTVQLGQTSKNVREILELGPGQVIELDRLAGDAVDILVNGRLVAKAEVVVIGENFGVRITELLRPEGGKKQ